MLRCPQLCLPRSNFYSLYVRRNATVLYRGPEFAQYARQLTQSAQLYTYSGGAEAAQLLKHSGEHGRVCKGPHLLACWAA